MKWKGKNYFLFVFYYVVRVLFLAGMKYYLINLGSTYVSFPTKNSVLHVMSSSTFHPFPPQFPFMISPLTFTSLAFFSSFFLPPHHFPSSFSSSFPLIISPLNFPSYQFTPSPHHFPPSFPSS